MPTPHSATEDLAQAYVLKRLQNIHTRPQLPAVHFVQQYTLFIKTAYFCFDSSDGICTVR